MSSVSSKEDDLRLLNDEIRAWCLSQSPGHVRVLSGYGSPYAKTMFVSESPSINGIEEGLCPLMRGSKEIFEQVLGLFNETVDSAYTTNLVKWSVLFKKIGDFDLPQKHFLFREIALIDPKVLVILSSKVSNYVFKSKSCSSRTEPNGRKTIFYFHPVVVLRGTITVAKYIQGLKRFIP